MSEKAMSRKWPALSLAIALVLSPTVYGQPIVIKNEIGELLERTGLSLFISGERSSSLHDSRTPQPLIALKDAPGSQDQGPSLDWTRYKIKAGQNLGLLFKKAGIDRSVMASVVSGSGEASDIQKIFPGETIKFGKLDDGTLYAVELERTGLESLVVRKDGDGFVGETVIYEPDVVQKYAGGVIDSSLFKAGKDAGLSTKTIMSLAGIFAWDIDFAKSIQRGDAFHVVYEDLYRNGKHIGTGDILSASFVNKGEQYDAVLYTTEDGSSAYYTPEGKSLRKAFLRSPVDFARISSHFNLRRKHPILHSIRAHKGTDYAAAPGTPVKASGDGKVIKASTYGGYGNTVIIQHGGETTTLYAHLRGFAPGLYAGKRVSQGDVIGYVGSSGLATGPHLHYEFRVKGQPKDPVNVALADAKPVPDREIHKFKTQTQPLMLALETRSSGKISSLAALSQRLREMD